MSGVRIPDFAGVALVDILANGVATLIIIIALSISARFEHEETVLDQVAETAVVLSREFSDKLVVNKLSGSAPARLHDYERSPSDQILDIRVLPIFELHADFVRDFYSGHIYPRSELLLKETRLDERLRSFNATQKRRIRIDIYDIQQSYVFSSILRSHNIRIAHWHFLGGGGLDTATAIACPGGTAAQDCAAGAGLGGGTADVDDAGTGDSKVADALGDLVTKAKNVRSGLSGGGTPSAQTSLGSGSALDKALGGREENTGLTAHKQALPGDVDLTGLAKGPNEENYTGEQQQPYRDQLPGGDIEDDSEQWHRDVMRGMGQSSEVRGEGKSAHPSSANMRLAIPGSGSGTPVPSDRKGQQSQTHQIARDAFAVKDLQSVLLTLLHYVRDIQARFDAGYAPWVLMSDFKGELSKRLTATVSLSDADKAWIDPLVEEFNAYWPDTTPPRVRLVRSHDMSGLVLAVPTNKGIQEVRLLGDDLQRFPTEPLIEQRLTTHINLHPSVHNGVLQEIKQYGVLLTPLEQTQPEHFRWRALVYITPSFDDFILGFVYARYAPNGELLLHPESNWIEMNGQRLNTIYPSHSVGVYGWVRLFYGALVLGLLLLLWPGFRLWSRIQLGRGRATVT